MAVRTCNHSSHCQDKARTVTVNQTTAVRAATVPPRAHGMLTTSSHASRPGRERHGRDLSGALAGVPLRASRQPVIQEAAAHPERCRQHLRRARRHSHRPAHGSRQALRQAPQPQACTWKQTGTQAGPTATGLHMEADRHSGRPHSHRPAHGSRQALRQAPQPQACTWKQTDTQAGPTATGLHMEADRHSGRQTLRQAPQPQACTWKQTDTQAGPAAGRAPHATLGQALAEPSSGVCGRHMSASEAVITMT